MRWLLLASVLLLCLFLALLMAGAMLPVRHQVQGSVTVPQPPESVWKLIAEPEQQSKWRADVVRVEVLPERNSHPVIREYYKNGDKLAFELSTVEAPKRLVRKIVDESAFGGEWQIDLSPTDAGTSVRITERGEVYNPLFRFISRFVIGHRKTMSVYMVNLYRACGGKGDGVLMGFSE